MAKDRKISERGGVLPELGLDGRSANTFTSNFYDPISGVSGNPYAQNGQCLGPAESAEKGLCYANTQALIGIKPDVENVSVLGRGTYKVNDNLNAIGEYIYSRSEVITSVALTHLAAVICQLASPFQVIVHIIQAMVLFLALKG